MRPVYYLKSLHELEQIKNIGEEFRTDFDLIVAPLQLSRFGRLSLSECNHAIEECNKLKIPVFLEWDILMTETVFRNALISLKNIELDKVSAIRVQDIGAYNYLIDHVNTKIHLILESGNHNLLSIQTWEKVGCEKLDRLVLGIELPKEIIKKYSCALKTPIELQDLGKILLFYTPRSLLAKPLNSKNDFIITNASSEETPHKGFKVLENIHGTFMFLPKDQFLMDVSDDLIETGISHIRLDHRHLEGEISLLDIALLVRENSEQRWINFKNQYSGKFIRGYFNVNRSDAIFPKLKNSRIIKKHDHYIGKVVDVKKDEYLALSLSNKSRKLKVGHFIELNSPDGKRKRIQLKSIQDIGLREIGQVSDQNVVLIPHVGGTSVKAHVHFVDSKE